MYVCMCVCTVSICYSHKQELEMVFDNVPISISNSECEAVYKVGTHQLDQHVCGPDRPLPSNDRRQGVNMDGIIHTEGET